MPFTAKAIASAIAKIGFMEALIIPNEIKTPIIVNAKLITAMINQNFFIK
jgi:hypothetical protein